MTREEKFEKAVYDYFKKIEERMNGFDYFNHEHIEHAFIDGVEWADKNPKSSWISVNDDLPCNHKELLENEHYTKTRYRGFCSEFCFNKFLEWCEVFNNWCYRFNRVNVSSMSVGIE